MSKIGIRMTVKQKPR